MKTALLIALLVFSQIQIAVASGPPLIKVTTADAGVSYHLENLNARTEKDAKTLEEVEDWLRELLKVSQEDLVVIYPDERTSFRTVSDLLRRLKAAGVAQYAITTIESRNGTQFSHSVVGSTDKIRSN